MSTDYKLTTEYLGYRTKNDVSATDIRFLATGSQNMLINEDEKVQTRPGYTVFGAESASRNRIKSEFKWLNSISNEIFLREANGVLEWYSTVSSAWETLLTGLSTTKPIRFDTIWDAITGLGATELKDILVFVNNSNILYAWSGGMGTYVSSTATTIVINETIADEHFFVVGTRSIRVKDSGGTWREFTVDSQAGSTFTASGDDPTTFTFDAGAIVVQSVRSIATTPDSNFTNNTIITLENQLYVGSDTSRQIRVSRSVNYTLFTFSTPRIPTEGALITLDDVTTGMEIGETSEGRQAMVAFSGKSRAYRMELVFGTSSDDNRETFRIKPLISANNQGAISQELITKYKNLTCFVSNDKELVAIQNAETVIEIPLSDPIKPDFVAADFTNGKTFVWRNNIYVTSPIDGKTFILASIVDKNTGELRRFWQPPQILPFGLLTEYLGNLYGHSGAVTESYLAFTGTNDNDKPIAFKVFFPYNNYGDRGNLKNFTKYFTEMFMSTNAVVRHRFFYEYLGAKSIQEYEYRGDDATTSFIPNANASLGVNTLGVNPLGSVWSTTGEEPSDFVKFRCHKLIVASDIYEIQVGYEADGLDYQFQLICHGPEAVLSSAADVNRTK